MIHQGRKVLDEQIATIRRQYDPRTIEFDPIDRNADVSPIASLNGVLSVDRTESGYEIHLAEGTDCAAAIQRIAMAVAPARIELSRPRLEDIFIQIVSRSGATAEAENKLRTDLREAGAKAATV